MNLSFSRLINAPLERVFDAFTSPEGQRELYGQDMPGWIVQSRCDLRVGGVWEISFGELLPNGVAKTINMLRRPGANEYCIDASTLTKQ